MMGQPGDFYGLIKSSASIDEIMTAIKASGKNFETVQIGSMTAYKPADESEDDSYFAQAGPGMFIFGTEKGLTQFQAVNSGSAANATANAMLSSAVADTGGKGFLRVAGVFDDNMKQMMAAQMPAMASLNTFALAADYSNDFLSFALVMSAEDAAALEQMKMMMDAQLPMVAQMESSAI